LSADDPFSELESVATDTEPEPDTKPVNIPSSGSVFVFDLETVPDETRFPRPAKVEKVGRPDCSKFDCAKTIGMTVAQIEAQIPQLSEQQLQQLLTAEGQREKPRVGVQKAIQTQLAMDNADDHEAAMMEWRKLSFNPFGCRIVALGIRSAKHHVTMLAKDLDEERELLRVLWSHVGKFKTRCGYNITNFDDAVLVMRSMLLGVDASERISRKKFGDRASIDLMTCLFPAGPAQKLKDVCKMIGIVPPVGYEMSGDKVFDLVEAGDWAGIAAYVESDATIEYELYQRLSEYVLF